MPIQISAIDADGCEYMYFVHKSNVAKQIKIMRNKGLLNITVVGALKSEQYVTTTN